MDDDRTTALLRVRTAEATSPADVMMATLLLLSDAQFSSFAEGLRRKMCAERFPRWEDAEHMLDRRKAGGFCFRAEAEALLRRHAPPEEPPLPQPPAEPAAPGDPIAVEVDRGIMDFAGDPSLKEFVERKQPQKRPAARPVDTRPKKKPAVVDAGDFRFTFTTPELSDGSRFCLLCRQSTARQIACMCVCSVCTGSRATCRCERFAPDPLGGRLYDEAPSDAKAMQRWRNWIRRAFVHPRTGPLVYSPKYILEAVRTHTPEPRGRCVLCAVAGNVIARTHVCDACASSPFVKRLWK
ncbi:MAG TPA: hypothetical protein VKD22_07925 [Ramlibacter sp.]|nr:hypothetical protein [Ramlibacter sp.]